MANYRGGNEETIPLIDSDLPWDVNVEESMWSLVPKECIHVSSPLVRLGSDRGNTILCLAI